MNYILFFPDEMRAESLSCYGNEVVKTPNYQRLSDEGVTFEQCHVQNTVCSPSRCSLLTGQYVHVAGHRTLWHLLRPHENNFFKYLKEAGYEVVMYGKNDLFAQDSFKLSTDEAVRHNGTAKTSNTSKLGDNDYYNFIYNKVDGDKESLADYHNVKAAIDFINNRKKDDKPFVLFLPLSYPHCPYTCPDEFYNMYDTDKLPELRPKGNNKPKIHELIREYRNLGNKEDLKRIQSLYLGMVSYMDSLLGKLLDSLKQSEIANETMFVASADHGDYAGDYDLVEKWPNGFEDVLTRVPLLVKYPGCKEGHRVDEQVELFDIMATIMEDANIEAEHTHFAKSFMPQLYGEKGDPDRAVYCEGGYDTHEMHCNEGYIRPARTKLSHKESIYYPKARQQIEHPESVCRGTMIRTLTHKLVLRTSGENELYDLVNDPLELNNIYDDSKYLSIQTELEKKMLLWYMKTSDVVPFDEDPRGFAQE